MSGIMARRRVGRHRAGGGGLGSAWDDNFDVGTSVDTAGTRFAGANPWIIVNGGAATSLNLTDVPGSLRITKTTNNGTRVCIMQAAPAGDFTAFTKCTHTVTAGNYVTFGFWIADGVTAGAGDQYRAGLTIDSGATGNQGALVYHDKNYNTSYAFDQFTGTVSPWGPYLRLSRSGGTVALGWSGDGASWTDAAAVTPSISMNYLGLGYVHERASAVDEAIFEFFAVVDGVAGAALPGTAA